MTFHHLSHEESCRIHAKRRLQDRLHITVNRLMYKDLVGKIKRPYAGRKMRESWHIVQNWKNKDRSVWVVRYEDKLLPVVYDRKKECIVTCLPEQVLQYISPSILKEYRRVI